MEIRFYKEADSRWYADLPDYINSGGNKEDCEMVSGADHMLNIISEGENETTLSLHVKPVKSDVILELKNEDEFYGGANYFMKDYKGITYNMMMWLCSVTQFVFGNYPEKIYINKL